MKAENVRTVLLMEIAITMANVHNVHVSTRMRKVVNSVRSVLAQRAITSKGATTRNVRIVLVSTRMQKVANSVRFVLSQAAITAKAAITVKEASIRNVRRDHTARVLVSMRMLKKAAIQLIVRSVHVSRVLRSRRRDVHARPTTIRMRSTA